MAENRTSIVLLADASLNEVEASVRAIQAHTAPGSYELIAVDPEPDGPTTTWLSEQCGLSLIAHQGSLPTGTALNLGLNASKYDRILLLSARVIVTANYLPLLCNALESDPRVGAVGPATNSIHGQNVPASYQTPEELAEMAAAFNVADPARWDRRLRLSCACLLLRRDALEAVGPLDEGYTLPTLLEADLSFGLLKCGWSLVYARDVFVHYEARPHEAIRSAEFARQCARFVSCWGFDPTYSSIQRSEIVALLDPDPPETPLRVLELGCACGATLLEIKNRYPHAQVYGIELNEGAVAIGRHFADIRTLDAEMPLDYPEDFFDYVITADVLEHLVDPWRVVANLRPHLKDTGRVIASIPNIMHVSVMRDLLNGRFRYQDAGILDRTHLRFFTLNEIDSLFAGAGYGARSYTATTIPVSEEDLRLVDALKELSTTNTSDQFRAYQYLVKVAK
jgi:SAM-dependent methyltransferase/GT2 family glycosyltransferase